jgi:hypothetical protein
MTLDSGDLATIEAALESFLGQRPIERQYAQDLFAEVKRLNDEDRKNNRTKPVDKE